MSFPPYIPGALALICATAAALSPVSGTLTPADADSMTEVGFLRWVIVAIIGAAGALGWKLIVALQANTAAIESLRTVISGRGEKDHDLITEIARDSLKA